MKKTSGKRVPWDGALTLRMAAPLQLVNSVGLVTVAATLRSPPVQATRDHVCRGSDFCTAASQKKCTLVVASEFVVLAAVPLLRLRQAVQCALAVPLRLATYAFAVSAELLVGSCVCVCVLRRVFDS